MKKIFNEELFKLKMSWKSSSSWHVGYDRATIVQEQLKKHHVATFS